MLTATSSNATSDSNSMKYKSEVNVYHLIHKVKHGYKMLLEDKAIFPSQYHLAASILGLGIGMTGLYIVLRESKMSSFYLPWATEGKDTSKIIHVAGLRNLGNNCFLNVVLQPSCTWTFPSLLWSLNAFLIKFLASCSQKALASSSCFVHFLQNVPVADVESIEECTPLLAALAKLLGDLSITYDKKTILDPQSLMPALSFYVSSFKLNKQQDAAEALLHLLSSLEEEILQCYVPHSSSLSEITSLPSRIHEPKSKAHTQCEPWRNIFGPVVGAIGSILTCRSCSSLLSMDIEHFSSLLLSPVLDRNNDIIEDCSIMDCLAQFTEVEYLKNYQCDCCWHIAALKHLSLTENKDKEKIDKLKNCTKVDCCDCKRLFLQEEIKWSGLSCVTKQLSLTRCPKSLCIHLQRVSMNDCGELIKLQGHISFPFILDLFPFTAMRKSFEEIVWQSAHNNANKKQQLLGPQLFQMNMQFEKQIREHLYRTVGEKILLKDNFQKQSEELRGDSSTEIIVEVIDEVADSKSKVVSSPFDSQPILDNKASEDSTPSSMSFMYRLSSVVEHYGKSGSGHYAVYRRVPDELSGGNSRGLLRAEQSRWFYISDHEVSDVSVDTVFAAEASLLFYERIDGNLHVAA